MWQALLGGALDFMANENLQDQAQGFNAHEAALNRDFNSAQALAQRKWQQHMSNTAVQRNKRDLMRAGFNPLLSVHPGGGATTPSGAAASGSAATSPGASSHSNLTASMASASQVQVNEAQADLLRAEAEEVRKRTPRHEWDIAEIKARIPVHEEQVPHIRQQIAESKERINQIVMETQKSEASAVHLYQQTANLQAALPLVKAQISQLRALAAKESAETDEIKQRIKENLPQLERALGNLERLQREMSMPGHANAERAAESFMGQLGAYLKHINPLIPNTGLILNPRSSTPRRIR